MSHNAEVIALIKKLEKSIKDIIASNKKWWEKIEAITTIVVPEVEVIGEAWKGSEKKDLAMEIIDHLWFENFNIKYIPDVFEKFLVRKVSSILIEKIVKFLNDKGIFKHKSTT